MFGNDQQAIAELLTSQQRELKNNLGRAIVVKLLDIGHANGKQRRPSPIVNTMKGMQQDMCKF